MNRPDGAAKTSAPAFEMGPWRVEPGLNRLVGLDRQVPVEPRAMDFLICLARHSRTTVSKEQLLDEVWGGAFVVEGVIPKTVFALRQALGDDASAPQYVLTVPRRGYRLMAPVRWLSAANDASADDPVDRRAQATAPGPLDRTELAKILAQRLPFRILWSRALASWPAAILLSGVALLAGWMIVAARDRPPPSGAALRVSRLAVAPFEARDGAPASTVLAGALGAETIGELVRFERPRIHLLDVGAVRRDGAAGSAAAAGADAVLTGGVEAGESRVRVDLQLVEIATREVRWSASFERPPGELWALRRAIASEVAVRVGAAAATSVAALGPPPAPIDGEVYRRFLEARFLWSRRDPGELDRAHRLFESVTRDEPDFGAGHAWLAVSLVTMANYTFEDPVTAFAAAETSARRAIALAPDDPVVHAAMGLVALNHRAAVAEAIAEHRRAIALAPSFAPAWQFLAEALAVAGRFDEAVAAADEAISLEPLSPVMRGVRGLVLLMAQRNAEALEDFERTLLLEPRFAWVHRYRAHALILLDRPQEAVAALLQESVTGGENSVELAKLRAAVEREGVAGYWRWRLDRLLELRALGWKLRPSQVAEAYAARGRNEEALAELAGALAAGDGEYFLYYRWSPAFDELRRDARFQAIYARHGL